MTRPTSAPYRSPDAPPPPVVRRVWALTEWGRSDGGFGLALVVALSGLFAAGCFVAYGPAPFVQRWAAVNVVGGTLWCLAFVRREAVP